MHGGPEYEVVVFGPDSLLEMLARECRGEGVQVEAGSGRLLFRVTGGAGLEPMLERLDRLMDRLEPEAPGGGFQVHVRDRANSEPLCGDPDAEPFSPAPGLEIRPVATGENPAPTPGVLWVDPGAAFGSGRHPTTRLTLRMLRELADRVPGPCLSNVLDAGCGTGILAMTAAALGATRVVGVEPDPASVCTAKNNVARNGLADRVEIIQGGFGSVTGTFDLVLANLVPSVLFAEIGTAARVTAQGGSLVVSGYGAVMEADVVRAFEAVGFVLDTTSRLDGWCGAMFTRAES
ncbi:MAG: 50S ribosomal protein L11 methyltransferase [Desulfatibacillaceae bacterium]